MSDVAFITGASSGFGRGLALRLARRGWSVGLAARRVERLEAVAEEVRAAGGAAAVCPCDVSERGQVLDAAARVEEELGSVDLLFANAGVDWPTRATELDGAEVAALTAVNYLGAVYATEAVLPGMRERGRGRLVAVGSLAGYGGLPFTAAYCASKAAVDKFFESLRIDLRGTGVQVTVVTPGYVKTEMTDDNPYPMPFLMELEPALDRIERAIDRGGRRVGFPWPLWFPALVGQVLPRSLYDRLAAGQDRDPDRG
jgi:short-subunit dehydrogenase